MSATRHLLVVLLLVVGLALAPQQARARTARAELSPAQIESARAITWAAGYWGVSAQWLSAVAWCESGLLPWAYNAASGASGLFQFMPQTYWAWAAVIGEQRSYWNAWASANVAAWAFAHGYSGAWACARA